MVSISISLNKFDLKQCGESPIINTTENEIVDLEAQNRINSYLFNRDRDPFYGTDKCDRITTDVIKKF